MRNRILAVAALAVGGVLLSKQIKKVRNAPQLQSSVTESIELNVPVEMAYQQWTRFEQFPQFMNTVQEVRRLDDTHLHWKADVAGTVKEWDAEITEQVPNRRIAWRSTSGVRNGGVVYFDKIADDVTRIMLQMEYEPEGMVENIGDWLGAVRMQARGNLEKFKQMLELRGPDGDAWQRQSQTPATTQH